MSAIEDKQFTEMDFIEAIKDLKDIRSAWLKFMPFIEFFNKYLVRLQYGQMKI